VGDILPNRLKKGAKRHEKKINKKTN